MNEVPVVDHEAVEPLNERTVLVPDGLGIATPPSEKVIVFKEFVVKLVVYRYANGARGSPKLLFAVTLIEVGPEELLDPHKYKLSADIVAIAAVLAPLPLDKVIDELSLFTEVPEVILTEPPIVFVVAEVYAG